MGFFDRLFGRRNSECQNGLLHSTAIPVGSVEEEYLWMQRNFPGFQPRMQSMLEIDGKPFDVLTLQNACGEERTVYFEISKFYGKPIDSQGSLEGRRRWQGPPCPYCGAALRTEKAKQCFKCGMDWRDSDSVVCRKQDE
jgi:hypothetical protein